MYQRAIQSLWFDRGKSTDTYGYGLTGQLLKTAATTGRIAVGYAPDIPAMAWGNAASQGIPIARTLDELIAIIGHLG